MSKPTPLEQAAVSAHQAGDDWSTFWNRHAADVARAEPHDARQYHRLVRRLIGLVASGDVDGAEPVPNGWSEPMPWELDDLPVSAPRVQP